MFDVIVVNMIVNIIVNTVVNIIVNKDAYDIIMFVKVTKDVCLLSHQVCLLHINNTYVYVII